MKDLIPTNPATTQPKPSEYAHIPTPTIPRDNDEFLLYIILDSTAHYGRITINTFTTHDVPPGPGGEPSPMALRIAFAELHVDLRNAWNRFVAEMESRPQLKNKAIVARKVDVHNGKAFIRVCGVERIA